MSELLNQTIGGYHLLEVIGGGGVATVYRARAPMGEQREVAVKVIYPEFARQPSIAANFAQITRAASQLASHPHILPVIGSGEDREYLYLVTPLVKEGSLATWMANGGRLGAGDAGPFYQQLCGAVSYAHSIGLTHGNIKPSNVYLFEGRHVLLGDFGLLWDVSVLDPSWSGSDVAAFEYLAPEVFDGRVSPASDIYSLGATLFATVTGHAPFHLNRLGDLVGAARQQTTPSLGQQTPPLAGPIVALDPVVRQAMAKQPEKRYGSADLLGQAIEMTLRQAAAHSQVSAPVAPAGAVPPPPPSAPLGAPAPGGLSAPLGQLNPPFPPLTPMQGMEFAMERPGAAQAAGTPPAGMPRFGGALASAGLEMPAVHPPANPLDGPTLRVAAPQPVDYPDIPDIPSSRLAAVAPIAPLTGDMDAIRPELRPRVNSRPGATPMPPAQIPGGAGAHLPPGGAAASGTFSATALELPRLTNPALATELPPDWRDLITDESARRRHDPFAASESALVPLPPMEEFGSSRDDLAALGDGARHSQHAQHAQQGQRGQENREWEEASIAWDEPAARSSWDAYPESGGGSGALNGTDEHYDIERMVATSARVSVPVRGRPQHEDDLDTLHGQKVWTNSRAIVRGVRRPKAPFFTVVALLALTSLELVGIAMVRPDICVTHACTVVATYARHLAPGLNLPGVTAPVYLVPAVPQVTVMVDGLGKGTFTLTNSSADPITWSATPTLAWMSVSPSSGTLQGRQGVKLTVSVTPHGVAPGLYAGALAVTVGPGKSYVPLHVMVTPGAQLAVTQRSLVFTRCGVAQSLSVKNTGGAKLSFSATASQDSALQVSPASGELAPGRSTALSVTMVCGVATSGAAYDVIIVGNGGNMTIAVTYSG